MFVLRSQKSRIKKMKSIVLTMVLSAFYVGFGFAQMEVKTERVFTGAALSEYLNEGADLYYEYGFKELVSRQIVYKDEEFTVDIYTMDTPLNAFGIYSVHACACVRFDSLGQFDCLTNNQLQAVDGNAYLSISFPSGSDAARDAATELYRMFVVDGKTDIRIPNQLMYMADFRTGTVKYMNGKLGVSKVQPSLLELLNGISNYEIWYVENAEMDNLALFLLQGSRDNTLLQRRIPNAKIIRRGERFVMMKD